VGERQTVDVTPLTFRPFVDAEELIRDDQTMMRAIIIAAALIAGTNAFGTCDDGGKETKGNAVV
jgi:hypothetical protein